MTQLLRSLYTPTVGMYDSQKRIETAAQNIANVNTDGYSRQRVETVSNRAYNTDIAGRTESGHDTLRVARVRDTFLDSQIRQENGILGEYESKAEVLSEVETAFLEPSDNGLNKAMSEMWNSWQELSKNPSEVSVKTVVTQTTENLAVTFNVIASRLDDIKTNSKNVIENEVFNLNKTLERIDSLNDQIYKSTIRNVAPNTLLDERDLLLNEVSESINIDVTLDKYNRATVMTGGEALVVADPAVEIEREISFVESVELKDFSVAQDGSDLKYEITLALAGDGVKNKETIEIDKNVFEADFSFIEEGNIVSTTKDFSGTDYESLIQKIDENKITGKIKGYNDSYSKIGEYVENLDNLANSIAQRINVIHTEGGTTSVPFFEGDDNGFITADNIKVNSNLIKNPEDINTDKVENSNDGRRALAIASLRNYDFSIDGSKKVSTDELAQIATNFGYDSDELKFDVASEGASFDDYYTNLISNVGTEKQSADRMVENEEALIEQLDIKKESISGVSLDEEIANLVQFQNSYAANAKVMSTLVEMLDILMNNTGL